MTVLDLLDRQAAMRSQIEDRTLALILAQWDRLGSYREEDAQRFLTSVLPVIQAAQSTTGQVTSVYIAQVIAEMTQEAAIFTPIAASAVSNLRPVAPSEVYQRPFVAVYKGLADGAPLAAAAALGRDRLTRLLRDDLSLAHRRSTLMAIDARDDVIGYRRVIRPELARKGTCGLCIAASDQTYSRSRLMPIHTRCNCEVMPIVRGPRGRLDPGRSINGQDISDLYRGLGTTDRTELASARFSVHEHGELGPVLRRQGDDFVGPGDFSPTPAAAPAA